MKFNYLILLTLMGSPQVCFGLEVSSHNKVDPNETDSQITGQEYDEEYQRYLKEVVGALESDPEFQEKLKSANETQLKSGTIVDELEFVSRSVRTKLNEIKRVELQRLKKLAEKKRELENQMDDDRDDHVDHTNPHTFEIEDLKKLMAKSADHLKAIDKERKEKFKEYEMEKEYRKRDKLNHTDGEAEREALEEQFKERKKHEKLHEPGHEAQLKEVWEEQDQMEQDFDPKTFFMLHDLDGNGLWDQDEVKALFYQEVGKVHDEEDDEWERAEEMERMRESMFAESDYNNDGLIDFEEFMKEIETEDFKHDDGWEILDEQTEPYSPDELEEYIRSAHGEDEIKQEGVPHVNQALNDHH